MERSVIKKKFNKITVACHDAGGSEIICSLLKEKKINFFAFVSGPARKIFKKHFKILKKSNLNFALNNSDYLLTGTSIKSKFELNIILKAKKKNLLTKSFLDHWVNYRERFIRNGKIKTLPHHIITGDKDSKKIAKRVFPKLKILMIDNPSWKILKNKRKKKLKKGIIKILFTSSYFKKNDRINPEINFTGPEMVSKFLKKIEFFFPKQKDKIKCIAIRHHPRESSNKYLKFVDKKKGIYLDKNNDLLKSNNQSTHIIGCESMATVYGKILGKKTFNIDIGISRLKTLPKKFFDKEISIF